MWQWWIQEREFDGTWASILDTCLAIASHQVRMSSISFLKSSDSSFGGSTRAFGTRFAVCLQVGALPRRSKTSRTRMVPITPDLPHRARIACTSRPFARSHLFRHPDELYLPRDPTSIQKMVYYFSSSWHAYGRILPRDTKFEYDKVGEM